MNTQSSNITNIPYDFPKVSHVKYLQDVLHFTISDLDLSIANGIRRTLISNIPTVVMKGFPHEESNIHITKNTSKLNNEIIKMRLSCIPIHVEDANVSIDDLQNLQVQVSVKNTSKNVIYLTTEHFTIYNKSSKKFADKSFVQTLFPKNDYTNYFIDILRLQPPLINESVGEEIEFMADLGIATASEDAAFNVVCTCAYSYTPDPQKLEEAWNFEKTKHDAAELTENMKINWTTLNKERYYVPNSFDFKVESVGSYKNETLIVMACDILARNIASMIQHIAANQNLIQKSRYISEFCYDVILENENYTVGKIIERELFNLFFTPNSDSSILTFCGFLKEHPFENNSIIRIAFSQNQSNEYILNCLNQASENSVKRLIEISKYFKTKQ